MAPFILVVDDEVDFVATYERILRRHGHEVVSAGTRTAALAALEAQRFDLVVADMRLSDGNGLDVVRAARGTRPPPPVIVVTGYPSEAGRRHALEAGARVYLGKPFTLSGFLEVVESLLGNVR